MLLPDVVAVSIAAVPLDNAFVPMKLPLPSGPVT